MEMYIAYLIVTAIVAIAVFYACDRIHTKNMEELEGVRSVYHAGVVDTAADDIKWLADETIQKMNDQFQNMFKTITGES